MIHTPVLTKEVLEYLNPKSGENMIDCTYGEGGHAKEIEQKIAPNGKLLGIDVDPGQAAPICGSYKDIDLIAAQESFGKVFGILADLGYSSYHIEASKKGFSFLKDEPLDMRFSGQGVTAREIVNTWPEDEIKRILEEYGEEKFSKKIAKEILKHQGSIETTFQLKEIIESVVARSGKIQPATRTFQALRIAVNKELENLETFLPKAVSLLEPGGRLVVISFHSLEDRIVKNFFKKKDQEGIVKILTKKPIVAMAEEVALNPRSRSAKLRAIIKV